MARAQSKNRVADLCFIGVFCCPDADSAIKCAFGESYLFRYREPDGGIDQYFYISSNLSFLQCIYAGAINEATT